MSRKSRVRGHVGGEHFGISFPLGCLPSGLVLLLMLMGLPLVIDACNHW